MSEFHLKKLTEEFNFHKENLGFVRKDLPLQKTVKKKEAKGLPPEMVKNPFPFLKKESLSKSNSSKDKDSKRSGNSNSFHIPNGQVFSFQKEFQR